MKVWMTLILFLISGLQAFAKGPLRTLDLQDVQSWRDFQTAIQKQEKEEISLGQAYMISGSLLILGGAIGYHNAHTSVEKLAYSVTESLGVGGIGYGASLYNIGSSERLFYNSVEATQGLSTHAKDELARNFSAQWRDHKEDERLIKIVTHSIVAAVNLYNGLREEGELRQGLTALAGINLIAAISFTFQ